MCGPTSRLLTAYDTSLSSFLFPGEFYCDCSGSEDQKGSVREMLKLHPYEVVEVNPTNYPNYEVKGPNTAYTAVLISSKYPKDGSTCPWP